MRYAYFMYDKIYLFSSNFYIFYITYVENKNGKLVRQN